MHVLPVHGIGSSQLGERSMDILAQVPGRIVQIAQCAVPSRPRSTQGIPVGTSERGRPTPSAHRRSNRGKGAPAIPAARSTPVRAFRWAQRNRRQVNPRLAQIVCDRSKTPVASGVAAPRSTLVIEHDEPGNGRLASLMVAVEHVDGDASRRVDRLGNSFVQGCTGVAQGGLPEPDPTGADQKISLLRSKRRHRWRPVARRCRAAPWGSSATSRAGSARRWCAEHGDARSEIAQRDGEVNGPTGSLDERPSGHERKDPSVRELHLGCRIIWPGRGERTGRCDARSARSAIRAILTTTRTDEKVAPARTSVPETVPTRPTSPTRSFRHLNRHESTYPTVRSVRGAAKASRQIGSALHPGFRAR